MSYLLLLADDEPIERQALALFLKSSVEALSDVAVAESGVDLLNKAEALRPDIVIADVEMPGISGLETLRLLRARGLRTKTIVHTAYSNFSYAKQAIDVAVDAYVLKPAKREDLKALVLRLIRELDEEGEERKRLERTRRSLEDAIPIVELDFVTSILLGERNEDALAKCLSILGMAAAGGRIAVFFEPEVDYPSDATPIDSRASIKLAFDGLAPVAVGPFLNGITPIFLTERDGAVASEACAIAVRRIAATGSGNRYAGIGGWRDSLKELRSSYSEAMRALGRADAGSPVVAVDGAGGYLSLDPLARDEDLIRGAIGRLDGPDALRIFRRSFDELVASKAALCILKDRVLSLALAFSRRFDTPESDPPDAILGLSALRFPLQSLLDASTAGELRSWMEATLETLVREEGEKAGRSVGRHIEGALLYIERNYMRNISLEMVAEDIGVSPYHLSHLFARRLGKGYLSYLTEFRINKAIAMMGRRKLPLDQLASAVGYSSPSYFCRVFKKVTGRDPRTG
jgi:two-component system, response regulator YesN